MAENNAGSTAAAGTEGTENKTFTQEELNAIVEGRLQRERQKYADYESLKEKAGKYDDMQDTSKTDSQKANKKIEALQGQINAMLKADEIRKLRDKVSKETGVPAALLTGDTEEICMAQANAISAFAKTNQYPDVKDGGENNKGKTKTAEQQFGEWLEAQF